MAKTPYLSRTGFATIGLSVLTLVGCNSAATPSTTTTTTAAPVPDASAPATTTLAPTTLATTTQPPTTTVPTTTPTTTTPPTTTPPTTTPPTTTPPTTTQAPATTTAPTTIPTTTIPTTTIPTTTTTQPAGGAQPAAPSQLPGGWQLAWNDEFNGSGLDTTKWTPEHSTYGDGNAELQCHTPNNVSVGNGALQLQARKETVTCPNGSVRNYTSGLIRSRNKFSRAFGHFEMRARMPKGQGLWPAFWMLSQNYPFGGNGRSGEIDIVEVLGSNPKSVIGTMHWDYSGCGWQCSRTGKEYVMPSGDTADGFHTYAVEWESGRMAWYFDGIKYYEVGDNATYKWGSLALNLAKNPYLTEDPLPDYPAPFDATNPMYLLLNLSVGGNWPGAPDSTTQFPANYEVDWVRVYTR